MNQILKRTLLPGLVASSLLGVNLGAVRPASADEGWLRDIGAGAATSVVTGAVTGNHSVVKNAIGGAAAGAAVHAVRGNRHKNNVVRDAAAGAAAGVVTGELTGNHHPLRNAVGGGATGALIDILNR